MLSPSGAMAAAMIGVTEPLGNTSLGVSLVEFG